MTLSAAGLGLAIGLSVPAAAQTKDYQAKSPEVVERNAQGKAIKVKVGETVYDVCMSEKQDHCINPRAAGLNWGDRPLGYWPGNRS
ncbi:hypothetical protein N0B51_11715 [Tsuneonella sp. YG55]|uniref:LysM domain-containing protein n=1 Tax=Tsuneonella litorea TaxID=2976475 RepID=A0A9X2W237_9SPHN|nr:hypothetical protein [Tsuneonella litorea]MCT2559647.1 hypothetical protein [Tsuneonella litorea]